MSSATARQDMARPSVVSVVVVVETVVLAVVVVVDVVVVVEVVAIIVVSFVVVADALEKIIFPPKFCMYSD